MPNTKAARKITTQFVRHSAHGAVEVVHRRDCRYVLAMPPENRYPWIWAEGRDPSEWTGLAWFRPCSICCADLLPSPPESTG